MFKQLDWTKKNITCFAAKILISGMIIYTVLQAFLLNGLVSYYSIEESVFQNDFSAGQATNIDDTSVSQSFIAEGNLISNLFLYFNGNEDSTFSISLSDKAGTELKTIEVDSGAYSDNTWNQIAFDYKGLKIGSEYVLSIQSEQKLVSILVDSEEKPGNFEKCFIGSEEYNGSLVVGMQQTAYSFSIASALELAFNCLIIVFMVMALCYTVFNIEKIIEEFTQSEKKKGFLHAVYFATTLVLLFNPLDPKRTTVESWDRIIGYGIIQDIDVSRRISNFYQWMLLYGITLILFYLFLNHLFYKDSKQENKKVIAFQNNFIILADVNLALRCITYFSDQEQKQTIFYYSDKLIQLVMLLSMLYLLFNFASRIMADQFLQLELTAFCLAYPAAILSKADWVSGRLLFGFQAAMMFIFPFLIYWISGRFKIKNLKFFLNAAVLCVSLLPILSSLYFESLFILNQHGVFVRYPIRDYGIFFLFFIFLSIALGIRMKKTGKYHSKWKNWSYILLVFGVCCLANQLPFQSVYAPDLMETANSSILISDFLNFSKIPIIEHYGGHMMTGVWEGLIYAWFNHDYSGAIFSPYLGYQVVILAVLFFLLVKEVWNKDMALFATMFFPFAGMWNTFGLGFLVCLAIFYYIKKNTYLRASLIWMAFIWCALYRLDLGFSIGLSCICVMIAYVLRYKNREAAKQLALTLLGWGIVGCGSWTLLCFAKGINPLERLKEFLLISLSNQNWAYDNIGNTGNMSFAWCYLFIPFSMVVCMCCTILDKNLKKKIDNRIWLLLLFLGFAYFTNFSRGLTRHSLAESAYNYVLWDALFFLAIFISVYKERKKIFLPVLALLILTNEAVMGSSNYSFSSVSDNSVLRLENTIRDLSGDEWKSTVDKKEIVQRVKINDKELLHINSVSILVNYLLKNDETFVDFMNDTFLYSALNREDPAYISQSPLQLSGEYTQEIFVKEIEGTPIVLMPIKEVEPGRSIDLIPCVYRYYKVSEYIYQNYVPLCRYGDEYAIWCLPERYEDYKTRLSDLMKIEDCRKSFIESEEVIYSNCKMSVDSSDDSIILESENAQASVLDFQKGINLAPYVGSFVSISMECSSNIVGEMSLYYTVNNYEGFNEDNKVTATISEDSLVTFTVPVTEYTKMQLNIPNGCKVKIKSISAGYPVSYITYGYDQPEYYTDNKGDAASTIEQFHLYPISDLPNIWAENDKAIENTVCCELRRKDDVFLFDRSQISFGKNGNYLSLRANYAGEDLKEKYETNDERVFAIVSIGTYENGSFSEKYKYYMNIKEGTNDYLFRVSSDYNWYFGNVNAVKISCSEKLQDVEMKILEGD